MQATFLKFKGSPFTWLMLIFTFHDLKLGMEMSEHIVIKLEVGTSILKYHI